jgi:hypothetical protein
MPESPKLPHIKLPRSEAVPYVVIRRPDGTLALRHPDELKPLPAPPPAPEVPNV